MQSGIKTTPLQWFQALWKFSRPHTIVGTSLSVIGLALIALSTQYRGGDLFTIGQTSSTALVFYPTFLVQIIAALAPSLAANIYIVGLNQCTDIDIDRINKPHLPLASGEFSFRQGVGIVACTGLLAIGGAGIQGLKLFWTVALSMVMGTVYSLPPLRLKRFPFWAALCIFGVRGGVVNVGFFLHFRSLLGGGGPIPLKVWGLTGFVILFAFAIAIFKDIPDREGDLKFHIRTLTVRLGGPTVFRLACWVLSLAYLGIVGLSLWGLPATHPGWILSTHLGILVLFWYRCQRVNLSSHLQVTQFYQWIWKLFFLEYVIFPIACLLP
ncbi:homogentisate phytyltransferase [Acaryochloris sp. IP29b_bin.137]|uniref:homogentisate phytyltransferase n=1 Tax=Acaryochloris sp. IP29b_bin.137 TaxID=2969217 RepID=UPI0026052FFB|nr:homogentisate phytyltransferase [Acaryochloris sp. IP29b_bin.137]